MPFKIGQQKLFPVVQSPDDILTEDLLDAATGATNIVGSMGSNFSMTKDDMLGNIKKIRTKYETDKEKFRKLKDLLQDEVDKKEHKNDKSANVGGLWLKRGLEYLCEVFWELIKEHENCKKSGGKGDSGAVKTACKNAYEKTLMEYHNFITKGLVKGGLMMTPYKKDFYDNLADGGKDKEDEIWEEMKAYEVPFRTFVITLGRLFHEFDKKDKILEDVHAGGEGQKTMQQKLE
ncbi:hypothetical protein ACF0H5_017254 [Mactra antiquata]